MLDSPIVGMIISNINPVRSQSGEYDSQTMRTLRLLVCIYVHQTYVKIRLLIIIRSPRSFDWLRVLQGFGPVELLRSQDVRSRDSSKSGQTSSTSIEAFVHERSWCS